MIPDHLIDKAAQAIVTGMGGNSLLADMHPEDAAYARADARAALEAVAGRIWDDGYIAAEWNTEEVCRCNAWEPGECGCGNYESGHQFKRNPYKEAS